jgi:hypothetical protein
MEFTKNEYGLINDLCNVAWAAGAVKNPQMGQAIEDLRRKIIAKMEPPKPEEKPKKEGAKSG